MLWSSAAVATGNLGKQADVGRVRLKLKNKLELELEKPALQFTRSGMTTDPGWPVLRRYALGPSRHAPLSRGNCFLRSDLFGFFGESFHINCTPPKEIYF